MITDTERIQIINFYVKTIIQNLNTINEKDSSHQALLDSFSAIDVILTGIMNANSKDDIIEYLNIIQSKLNQEGFKIT